MKETLLQKAKKIGHTTRNGSGSDEEYELFLAWAAGEVGLTQACKALDMKVSSSQFYSKAVRYFKRYYQETNQKK